MERVQVTHDLWFAVVADEAEDVVERARLFLSAVKDL